MTGRLIILLLVLAALLVSYFGFVRELPGPSASPSTAAAPGTPGESPAGFEKPGPYPTEYDEVTVTIVIPPVSEFPPAWAEIDGCPQTRVSGALGAAIGPGNGCPVLKVEPDGPAAKAGI
ncbi:MAG: hypothetical protein GTN78_17580, partial [Gemmatimonadales bacterium]|nr:hypothetical protein [Gemmatimonadales bacterium]